MMAGAIGCKAPATGTPSTPAPTTTSTALGSCDHAPVGTAYAYPYTHDERNAGNLDFTGELLELQPATAGGEGQLRFRASNGQEHRIRYRIPGITPPLVTGSRYKVVLERYGRFPAGSALLISDDGGLMFASVSDIGVGQLVTQEGLPGVSVMVGEPACAPSAAQECFSEVRNVPLVIEHEGQAVSLLNGASAPLGDFQATCLTSIKATLNDRCADATPIAISYVLSRRKP